MRRKRPEIRKILPDPVFKDMRVAKFVNYIMTDGKKGVAESIFYGSLEIIRKQTKTDGLKIFEKAIENASPVVEVKSRRVGGATYQVPIEVAKKRRFYLKPMEKLLEQKLNSVQINEVKINDNLDIQYKPGLFLQTKSFVENDFTFFLSIKDQITAMNHYSIISGY